MTWINTFQEFEKKQKGNNRLILNFYNPGDETHGPKRIKFLVKKNVKIPTKFISAVKEEKLVDREIKEESDADKVKRKLTENEQLHGFPLTERKIGNFNVLEIEMPKNAELIHQLPSQFQASNYDKLLRLSGFYPERKAEFSNDLEERIKGKMVVPLDSLEDITFKEEFLTADELKKLPWMYFDIEKPLWKHDNEKKYLDWRKRILKQDKRFQNNDKKQEKRLRIIKKLEDKLTINVEGVGQVKLWEDNYDAAVSFITARFRNLHGYKNELKELYVLDPEDNFQQKEVNNYKVLNFKTEKELIKKFYENIRKRKIVLASGHNEVYDATQIRDAAKSHKLNFTPSVRGIKSRRDFVRFFFQRLKEDYIYLDTLWLTSFFHPYQRQRSFSSLKLESVANLYGIPFKKSLTHAQLREVELQRLAGNTDEIKKEGARRLSQYAASDVNPVVEIIDKSPFLEFLTKIKKILPYCTLTELAFHPNCAEKYHDKRHFDRVGNQMYHKYQRKQREDEIQIFKKRFASQKTKMLDWAGIKSKCSGEHKDVLELYLPFEEWISPLVFRYAPEFEGVYNALKKEEKLPFLQYIKSLQREHLCDYYFTRREEKIFTQQGALKRAQKKGEFFPREINIRRAVNLKNLVNNEILNEYVAAFKYAKNNFRSIYVPAKNTGRKLIRPARKNIYDLDADELMFDDYNLFLLEHNSEKIRLLLKTKSKISTLNRFLNTMHKIRSLEDEVRPILGDKTEEELYIYYRYQNMSDKKMKYFRKYGFSIETTRLFVAEVYKNLAEELKKHHTQVLEIKGDYMFVKADESIKQSPLVYVVRTLPSYEVKRAHKKEKIPEGQGDLFEYAAISNKEKSS